MTEIEGGNLQVRKDMSTQYIVINILRKVLTLMTSFCFGNKIPTKTAQLLTFYFLPLLLSIGFGSGTIELW